MSNKPRIAVTGDISGDTKKRWSIPLDYLDAISAFGGIPIPLPPIGEAAELLEEVDGMLFIGGDDYLRGNPPGHTPANFQAIDPRREETDFRWAQHAFDKNLPVLGICAGFQLLVLAAGGTIHGDLPTEYPSEIVHKGAPGGSNTGCDPSSLDVAHDQRVRSNLVHHPVRWLSDWEGIAAKDYQVNSHHHQATAALPESWRPLALAPDDVVEAAAGPGRFQLGIQWHPEKDREDPLNARLFQSFLKATRS